MNGTHVDHTSRSPGAVQHEVMHRRPGVHRPVAWVPVQQRTTIALRCARDTLPCLNSHDR
jgi:hypothetical protein